MTHCQERTNPKLTALNGQLAARQEQLESLRALPPGAEEQSQPLRRAIQKDMERLMRVKRELHRVIGRVEDPLYQTVLTLRYFCGFTWDQVGERMHYSTRHVQRIHRQALDYLEARGQDTGLFELARRSK